MDENATPNRSPFRRFPWIQLVFCLACLSMAAWTWMRYSYAWGLSAEDIASIATAEAEFCEYELVPKQASVPARASVRGITQQRMSGHTTPRRPGRRPSVHPARLHRSGFPPRTTGFPPRSRASRHRHVTPERPRRPAAATVSNNSRTRSV